MLAGFRRAAVPLAVVLCVLLTGLLLLGYIAFTLPLPRDLAQEPTQASLLLEAADGEVFASRGALKGRPVAFEELPRHLVHAVLAIEDRRFYDHGGVDPMGIARALLANLRAGGIEEGGSTITQQLAKVMFLSPERSFKRKLQEALVALWLERRLTKDEILARYLATIYFGAGAYGIEAAARRYFDKPVPELTLAEAAMLAGLIRAPSALAPTRDLEAAQRRAGQVLAAMVETGFVKEARAADARAGPARLAVLPNAGSGRNYFADWVGVEARRLVGPLAADLEVHTTLDLKLQDLAERVLALHLGRRGEARNVRQGALVVLAPDGAVLAMVGGRAYGQSQFNRVTQARRQPGSLFKLFVYLAALQAGFHAESVMVDRPVDVAGWQPRNHGGGHRGRVTLRTAFAQSINTVAVQLAERVGRERVIAVAADLGIASDLAPTPSLALGTSEVTLLEMTAAFAAVAANAKSVEPYGIRSIKGRGAGPDWRPAAIGEVGAAPAWPRDQMLDLLLTAVRSGTGKAARLARPAAGKTGTTQDNRDAWFVGFTGDLVAGVWLGNDDNAPMKGVTGGGLPAEIWRDFMRGAEALGHGASSGTGRLAVDMMPDETAAPNRVESVRPARPGDPAPSERLAGRPAMPSPVLDGFPRVLDTASLAFGRQVARLAGVRGEGGRFVQEMQHYIADRRVTCRPYDEASFRCEVGGYDLSEVVLYNGGGRSLAGAPPELKAAEATARSRRLGVWGK